MKNILTFTRTAFLALALGTALTPALLAQTTPAPSTPAAPVATDKKAAKKEAMLTADERAHLDKVRTQALAADPSLQKEAASLVAQHAAIKSGTGATDATEAKAALKTATKEHNKKLEVAMLKIDPSVAPILAKIKAAHKAAKSAQASA